MIPFVDLKAQYINIKSEIDQAVMRTLESASFILGPEVAAFETEFAQYIQAPYAIGVNTGTSALHLALLAAGVGPGDEVITVANTFIATVAAIGYTGARPVLVDVDPVTLTMAPQLLPAALTPRTKAIIPVHLYGQCADMTSILDFAREHRLVVIEDACQAHGARYKDANAGSMGDYAAFSFYPGKNLGAYGEGGMVVTRHSEGARNLRMLRDWGCETRYHHVIKGYNYRLEGIQGAILRVKLRYLEAWTEARRAHARRYDELLAGLDVVRPVSMAHNRHVYHLYPLRSPRRDELQKALAERGVQTGIHYPIPVHLQEAWRDLGYKAGDFPVTEAAAGELLSLPMYAELSDAQVAEVAGHVKEILNAAPV
jgi:dTDP-4-amino-4,6-dideoxygalactose transaminase